MQLRIRQEHSPDVPQTDVEWHGEVEHIQSGAQWTFQTLDELLGFLRRVAEDPEALAHCMM